MPNSAAIRNGPHRPGNIIRDPTGSVRFLRGAKYFFSLSPKVKLSERKSDRLLSSLYFALLTFHLYFFFQHSSAVFSPIQCICPSLYFTVFLIALRHAENFLSFELPFSLCFCARNGAEGLRKTLRRALSQSSYYSDCSLLICDIV
jgi:hypothetical protein